MSQYTPSGDKSPRKPTRWTAYKRYFCHLCGEECINHEDTARAEYCECASCVCIPDLDRAADQLEESSDLDTDPDSRQAGGVSSGDRRAQDGQKPGTAEGRARNVPRSEHAAQADGFEFDIPTKGDSDTTPRRRNRYE